MNILGIGTEIVECLRIAKLIEQHAEQFLTHAFTSREISFCQSCSHATQHFAGIWAGKQAVLKGLGVRWRKPLAWSDLEIRRSAKTGYRVLSRGGMREIIEQREPGEIFLTLAHCRTHATATAVILARE
ncbi:MAG: holo-ACP synthase [Pirellulales bacterium]|nr:holo-ACP synthase [Pirellulales bacterium]